MHILKEPVSLFCFRLAYACVLIPVRGKVCVRDANFIFPQLIGDLRLRQCVTNFACVREFTLTHI